MFQSTVAGFAIITGLIFTFISWRNEDIAAKAWFRWTGMAAFLFVLVLLAMNPRRGIDTIIVILLISACWFMFIASFIGNTIVAIGQSALSSQNVPKRVGYSRAEATAARGDIEGAVRMYQEMADAHPHEAEPLRRKGDLLLKLNLPDQAVTAYREAAARLPEPEDQVICIFAAAETLDELKHNAPAALDLLRAFAAEHPQARCRPYVENRIRALERRIGGGGASA